MPDSFVQVPPDSTGAKLRMRRRVVGANTVDEQGVFLAAMPTYLSMADNVAFAANKHMISILNAPGSGYMLALKKLFLVNLSLTAVTGVMLRQDVKRITAHSGGTVITPEKHDSLNPNLPAQVTVRTGATSVTEGATLFPLTFNNDEVGATQAFPNTPLQAGINWLPAGEEIQEIRLREGEGVTIKNITSTTVGSFAYLLVFTADDS